VLEERRRFAHGQPTPTLLFPEVEAIQDVGIRIARTLASRTHLRIGEEMGPGTAEGQAVGIGWITEWDKTMKPAECLNCLGIFTTASPDSSIEAVRD